MCGKAFFELSPIKAGLSIGGSVVLLVSIPYGGTIMLHDKRAECENRLYADAVMFGTGHGQSSQMDIDPTTIVVSRLSI